MARRFLVVGPWVQQDCGVCQSQAVPTAACLGRDRVDAVVLAAGVDRAVGGQGGRARDVTRSWRDAEGPLPASNAAVGSS
jgi:hypothetical protein